ncbi:hypothetical protein MGN70_008829 [Eutypa lata]|nr:hypothetical protein MGN70_008829 [Eutypa lata]
MPSNDSTTAVWGSACSGSEPQPFKDQPSPNDRLELYIQDTSVPSDMFVSLALELPTCRDHSDLLSLVDNTLG